MPGRPWGCDLGPLAPIKDTIAMDVVCMAGSNTVVLSLNAGGAIAAVAGGAWGLVVDVTVLISFGAMLPGQLDIRLNEGSNSGIDAVTLDPTFFQALTVLPYSVRFIEAVSNTIWFPTGSTATISVAPSVNDVSILALGSRSVTTLAMGPG